ncbi:MAG: DNA-processing protein DprA [Bacteroidota bacterium]
MSNELRYQIGITRLPKVGSIIAKNLISYCGTAQAVFRESRKALLKIPGVGPTIARHILNQQVLGEAEQEIQLLDKHNIQALYYLDESYPYRLKQLYDAPILLYYKGTADLNQQRLVSVVGTRRPSRMGVQLCQELVEGLRNHQVGIVSGLAYGIDIAAHRKAIELQMDTIGVLGHGLQYLYPEQHLRTAQQMIQRGGLLSEHPFHTGIDARHFPMRNRIIAGLCDALVVVETKTKGGSMISAEMAHAYHRDIFAYPSNAKYTNARGGNYLIKTHRAALIENAEDLVNTLRWEEVDSNKSSQSSLFTELSEAEKAIYALFTNHSSIGIDELAMSSGKTSSEMASLLLQLEFKGVIQSLPGKQYARC